MQNQSRDICKTVDSSDITAQQLEKINNYTRRKLEAEEVFVFSVVLCDNEVDRDLERFTLESLQKLAQLFPGKTGVFDHQPLAENQSARIFDTELVYTGEINSSGERYCQLKAWAYMARCDKNSDLILEIDAGIKKEVSVGCAVDKVECSICGSVKGSCTHVKGKSYGEKQCHHLLTQPTDVYEWSFVAVPAQKRAGVTKRWESGEDISVPEGKVLIDKARLQRLAAQVSEVKKYKNHLRKDVVRLGLMGESGLNADTLHQITKRLDIPELEQLQKSYSTQAAKNYPMPSPQLAKSTAMKSAQEAFRI